MTESNSDFEAEDLIIAAKTEVAVLKSMLESDPNITDAVTRETFLKCVQLLPVFFNDEKTEELEVIDQFIDMMHGLVKSDLLSAESKSLALALLDRIDPVASHHDLHTEEGFEAVKRIINLLSKTEADLSKMEESMLNDPDNVIDLDHQSLNKWKTQLIMAVNGHERVYNTINLQREELKPVYGFCAEESAAIVEWNLFQRKRAKRERKMVQNIVDHTYERIMELFDNFEQEYGCGYLN